MTQVCRFRVFYNLESGNGEVDSNVGAVGAIMELHRKVKLRAGLLNRLGGVVVKAGFPVFLFDEIKPVGGGVLEKIWVDAGTSPEPAFFGGPEPKIGI